MPGPYWSAAVCARLPVFHGGQGRTGAGAATGRCLAIRVPGSRVWLTPPLEYHPSYGAGAKRTLSTYAPLASPKPLTRI